MTQINSDLEKMIVEVNYIRSKLGSNTSISDAMQLVHAVRYLPLPIDIQNQEEETNDNPTNI